MNEKNTIEVRWADYGIYQEKMMLFSMQSDITSDVPESNCEDNVEYMMDLGGPGEAKEAEGKFSYPMNGTVPLTSFLPVIHILKFLLFRNY